MRKARCSAVLKKAQATAGWGFGAVVLSNSAQPGFIGVAYHGRPIFTVCCVREQSHLGL